MFNYRFQKEFLFRDTKQELDLAHGQTYSKEKINYHVNADLTVGSLDEVAHHLSGLKWGGEELFRSRMPRSNTSTNILV